MVDYLIVGSGLAGLCFAETVLKHGKSVQVYENDSQNSSVVAGGMYNPVVLKRFSATWKAIEFMNYADQFYGDLEQKFQLTFDYKLPVCRKFYSAEEQNNWFQATEHPVLKHFLSDVVIHDIPSGIKASFGLGKVNQTGYINTKVLLSAYKELLKKENKLREETFHYDNLKTTANGWMYQDVEYKYIIFAEGYGLLKNPFFGHLPLDGTKGELLIVRIPNFKTDYIIKSGVFIIPLGNDLFKVGATYHWTDKTVLPTQEGKKELVSHLKELLSIDFEIIEHLAGIRPTVSDRRPMIGEHPKHKGLFILNGLGTRGVTLGPNMAKYLFDYIERGIPIDPMVNIKRFRKIAW